MRKLRLITTAAIATGALAALPAGASAQGCGAPCGDTAGTHVQALPSSGGGSSSLLLAEGALGLAGVAGAGAVVLRRRRPGGSLA